MGWLKARTEELSALEAERARQKNLLVDRTARLARHGDAPGVQTPVPPLEAKLAETVESLARYKERMETDQRARRTRDALGPEVKAQKRTLDGWSELSALIGSADGKKLRTFAQSLTLDLLLTQANHHLTQLRPRYRLARVPGYDMELQVEDGDMGDEVRAVSTLSGGETFLVSLALALGLSSLSSRNVRIESLFIDEGFGHLDRASLDVALATLDQLRAEGRTIGLISHVPDIAERIGAQVCIEPRGPGLSEVLLGGTLPR